VDDPKDPRIADYLNVPDRELLDRRGLFVAEGRLVVERLLTTSPLRTRSVMVTETTRAALGDLLRDDAPFPVFVVPQGVMNSVTGFNLHRGCLAIGERPEPADWRALAGTARRLLVLERVGNADNVGGLFRNAAAFGVNAVLLDPDSADPLYRKSIRTSMAAALTIPFARAEPWPDALAALRAGGCATVALTPASDAAPLSRIAPEIRERDQVAIVLGHEGDGLTDGALAACEYQARIPMDARVDSLNVATAAAIALYELGSVLVK
jgi:tRNA G18 (ribose-2'-O)-methylase SpoU